MLTFSLEVHKHSHFSQGIHFSACLGKSKPCPTENPLRQLLSHYQGMGGSALLALFDRDGCGEPLPQIPTSWKISTLCLLLGDSASERWMGKTEFLWSCTESAFPDLGRPRMVQLSLQGTRSLLPGSCSSWKAFPGLLSLSQPCHPRTESWAVFENGAGSDDAVLTMDQILLTMDQTCLRERRWRWRPHCWARSSRGLCWTQTRRRWLPCHSWRGELVQIMAKTIGQTQRQRHYRTCRGELSECLTIPSPPLKHHPSSCDKDNLDNRVFYSSLPSPWVAEYLHIIIKQCQAPTRLSEIWSKCWW